MNHRRLARLQEWALQQAREAAFKMAEEFITRVRQTLSHDEFEVMADSIRSGTPIEDLLSRTEDPALADVLVKIENDPEALALSSDPLQREERRAHGRRHGDLPVPNGDAVHRHRERQCGKG